MTRDNLKPNSPLRNYNGEIFDCVVLDGSNIITQNIPTTKKSRIKFSAERLLKTLTAIQNLGWPTYLGMKKGTYRFAVSSKKSTLTNEDRKILEDLIDKGILSLIDDEDDDDWLIKAAIERNGWILSNDRYLDSVRKLINEKDYDLANEINKRSCRLEWVGREPLFILPRNHLSMEKTQIISNKRVIKEKLDNISKLKFRVTYDEEDRGYVKLSFNIPIGRKDFDFMEPKFISSISRVHFIIDNNGQDGYSITDLGSKNGTIVNNLSIAPNYTWKFTKGLKNTIKIGKLKFTED